MGAKYDFCGWATRNDLTCSDGRVIRHDAFKHCDGKKVPMVWMHNHDDVNNVLGHCLLENREDGVYTYGYFNSTYEGRHAKEMLKHDDVDGLSIYANHLKQNGNADGTVNVVHGDIKEVSLVLSGANPGALIDSVIAHGETVEDEIIIYPGTELEGEGELEHEDTDDSATSSDSDNPDDKELEMADNEKKVRTVEDVLEEMTDEQKKVVDFLIDENLRAYGIDPEAEAGDEGDEAAQSDDEGETEMKHNVFDNSVEKNEENTLSQADIAAIFEDARKNRVSSLKECVLQHADDEEEPTITYGIENIDYLFPENKNVGDMPNMISRDMEWVSTVISGCHHSPFARIKTTDADITADDARAKGYLKGNLKKEEFFKLMHRVTNPTTIYKKQKLDRDDITDITDFNVVAFIKTEMRTMLDEEIARAVLVGDGRVEGEDKISEEAIRPIYKDANLYSVKVKIDVENGAAGNDKAKALIDGSIRARKLYKGSGSPVCYMTEDMLTECLLLEDGIGHKMYADSAAVARAMRCTRIITVPVMEGLTDATNGELAAIIVNLRDYNIGADKGGAINMFDDFDIDYNQYKYLIETRCSGALTKPYSALVLSIKEAA